MISVYLLLDFFLVDELTSRRVDKEISFFLVNKLTSWQVDKDISLACLRHVIRESQGKANLLVYSLTRQLVYLSTIEEKQISLSTCLLVNSLTIEEKQISLSTRQLVNLFTKKSGSDFGGIQTHDLQNRNLTLYSAKLRSLIV